MRGPVHLGGQTIYQAASEPPPDLGPGATLADGRYTIARRLGESGWGDSYLARDAATGGEVVLRLPPTSLMSDEATAALLARETAVARVRHPGVAAGVDVRRDGDRVLLVRPFVAGTTLGELMLARARSGADLPVPVAAGLAVSILRALAAAHAAGVHHLDLRPERVVLLGDPLAGDHRVALIDVALASGMPAEIAGFAARNPSVAAFRAPEQTGPSDAPGAAADVYAVGLMLYKMLLDVLPGGVWKAPSRERADIPEALDAVLERALSARPRSRYETAAAFADAIEAATTSGAPKPEPRPEPTPPVDGSRRRLWIGGGVAAVLALGAIGAFLEDPGPTPYTPDPPPFTPNPPPEPAAGCAFCDQLRAQFASFPGVQQRWRLDADGSIFTVKVNQNGFIGTGFIDGSEVAFVLDSPAGASVYDLDDGQRLGVLAGSLTQKQAGFDFIGRYDNYQDGSSTNVQFHIDH